MSDVSTGACCRDDAELLVVVSPPPALVWVFPTKRTPNFAVAEVATLSAVEEAVAICHHHWNQDVRLGPSDVGKGEKADRDAVAAADAPWVWTCLVRGFPAAATSSQ